MGTISRERVGRGSDAVVRGTPRWAVVAAHAAAWSVVPSAIWRTAVGVGIPLGWTQQHLDIERIPGFGTFYVLALSVLSIAAARLTIGLVRPWGERIPRAVPLVGGRRLPIVPVVLVALIGAVVVAVIVVQSITHWSSVSGFAGRPVSPLSVLMLLCYLPAVAWAPLLLAVTFAYFRRRMTVGRAASRALTPR